MDRNEYCDRVLAQVGRLTSGEARDLRAELSGHIEDHAEALTALGYGEDEADERAVMLMGDPEETGRALRRCYRGWWLVLARYLMVTVTAVLCVLIANEMVKSPRFSDSDRYRAREQRFHWIELWGSETLNVQIPIGNDIVCVDGVSTGIAYDQIRGAQLAVVQLRGYDRIPGGVVYKRLLQELRLENQRGEVFFEGSEYGYSSCGGCSGTLWVHTAEHYVPIAPDDTYITLIYDRLGERIEVEIPLPERVVQT